MEMAALKALSRIWVAALKAPARIWAARAFAVMAIVGTILAPAPRWVPPILAATVLSWVEIAHRWERTAAKWRGISNRWQDLHASSVKRQLVWASNRSRWWLS